MVTTTPYKTDPVLDKPFSKAYVIVPAAIYGTFVSNKMDPAGILNYGKALEILNQEDRAYLLAVQTHPGLGRLSNCGFGQVLLEHWTESATADQRAELGSAICPMSANMQNADETLDRLSVPDKKSGVSDFKIVDADRNVMLVVLGDEFIQNLKNNEKLLEVVRAILKVLYVYHEKHEVSKYSLFTWYLELLMDTQ